MLIISLLLFMLKVYSLFVQPKYIQNTVSVEWHSNVLNVSMRLLYSQYCGPREFTVFYEADECLRNNAALIICFGHSTEVIIVVLRACAYQISFPLTSSFTFWLLILPLRSLHSSHCVVLSGNQTVAMCTLKIIGSFLIVFGFKIYS